MMSLFNNSACMRLTSSSAKEPIDSEKVPWEQSKTSKKYWIDKQQNTVNKDGGSGFNSRFYHLPAVFRWASY